MGSAESYPFITKIAAAEGLSTFSALKSPNVSIAPAGGSRRLRSRVCCQRNHSPRRAEASSLRESQRPRAPTANLGAQLVVLRPLPEGEKIVLPIFGQSADQASGLRPGARTDSCPALRTYQSGSRRRRHSPFQWKPIRQCLVYLHWIVAHGLCTYKGLGRPGAFASPAR
jgi:hypothetical protein